jgi:CHRD domain
MSALALVCAIVLAGPALAAPPADGDCNGGRPLSTTLTGAAEVPGPGDPDGSGTANLRVNPGQECISYDIAVEGIAPAEAAHIHEAPADEAGPVVVGLAPPTDGSSSGTVDVSREQAKEIVQDPDDYYVNVHNAEYPAGALRGQLSK